MPTVSTALARKTGELCVVEIFGVEPVRGVFAERSAVLHGAKSLGRGSCAGFHPQSGRGRSFLGEDADYAIHGVGAPNCSARAAAHFDPVDVIEWHILQIPKDAVESGREDNAPINQDQQLVAVLSIEPTRADCPGVVVDLRHIQTRHHPQQVWDVARTGAGNVVLRDNKNGGSHIREFLFLFPGRGDLDVHEVFNA